MKLLLTIFLCLSLNLTIDAKSKKKRGKLDPIGKKLFETNCLACHDPLKAVVGPTLHEINKLYENKVNDIVSWAQKPGRKRTEGIAMPAMGHIPETDLKKIAEYMLYAGSRVSRKELRKVNTFVENLGKIQRTFMPDSSVVSFAIKLSEDLSLCWDAERGTTRYIWQGTIDPKTHFTGNGKVIPEIKGDKIYQSQNSFFRDSSRIDYLGYKVNQQGLPSFFYKRNSAQFIETLNYSNGQLTWNYKISGLNLIKIKLPQVKNYKTLINKGTVKNGMVALNDQDLKDFTITLKKDK